MPSARTVPRRFNEIMRIVGGISQRMLTLCAKDHQADIGDARARFDRRKQ